MSLQSTLKALSDPIRREILNLLKQGRMSAGDIAEHREFFGFYGNYVVRKLC